MDKKIIPLTIAVVCSFLFFTVLIFVNGNYEFFFYLLVVLLITFIIYRAHQRVHFPLYVLWNLLVWAILHLAGGNLKIMGTRLYDLIIYPLIGEPYSILKYDQVIHAYGFFVATLAMYYTIKPLLQPKHQRWTALGVVVVMAGLGLGALNEIVEFIITVVVQSTGVGSYINNALDLVFNFLGALIAFVYLKRRETC